MSNRNGTKVAGVRPAKPCIKGLLALMLLLVGAGHGLAQSAPYRVLQQWPGGDTTRQRRDYTFNYKTWDNTNWSARLEGNRFVHAPNGDWSRAHRDTIIKYVTWGGSLWTAQVGGNEFVHAPNGDWSRSHRDTIVNYMDWGARPGQPGSKRRLSSTPRRATGHARIRIPSLPTEPGAARPGRQGWRVTSSSMPRTAIGHRRTGTPS